MTDDLILTDAKREAVTPATIRKAANNLRLQIRTHGVVLLSGDDVRKLVHLLDTAAASMACAMPESEIATLTTRATSAEAERDAALALVAGLRGALGQVLDMCDSVGTFSNGVTDPTGTIDEGDYQAARVLERARAALAASEPQPAVEGGAGMMVYPDQKIAELCAEIGDLKRDNARLREPLKRVMEAGGPMAAVAREALIEAHRPSAYTKALAAAEARGIAVGRQEERDGILVWLALEREKYRSVFRDDAVPMGMRENACLKALAYTEISTAIRARARALPHDPSNGDEGRGAC